MDIKILGFRGNIDSVGKTLDKINNLKNNDEERLFSFWMLMQ